MNLKDTVEMMLSDDYKERFKGEYYQLKIRHDKLCNLIEQYELGKLNFELSCPIELLIRQLCMMRMYKISLEVRAEIENIIL